MYSTALRVLLCVLFLVLFWVVGLGSWGLFFVVCGVHGSAETKKVKNVSENQFGDKLGRIHLGRQDLSSMKVMWW